MRYKLLSLLRENSDDQKGSAERERKWKAEKDRERHMSHLSSWIMWYMNHLKHESDATYECTVTNNIVNDYQTLWLSDLNIICTYNSYL